jgi:UDP-arabinose 4-epimerase
MNKVLITGGAGYIGSHTARLFAQQGYQPVVVDNLSMGHRWAVQYGPFHQADLLDGAALRGILRAEKPVAVVHFAASAFVGESVSNPGKYYRNNFLATMELLDAMRDCDVNRMVFSSTCATYGTPTTVPIPEEHPQNPINPYGESKLFIEKALASYAHAYGLQWMALRYFNAAGADASGEIGEHHSPETHLIPLILETALGRRPQVSVFGTDYPTPDGSAVRDYIHVNDLGAAHLAAVEHLLANGPNAALNLGTGHGYSVLEVIAAAERITGKAVKHELGPRRAGDPPALVAQAAKARTMLNFVPQHSDLDQILRTAYRWHAEFEAQRTR